MTIDGRLFWRVLKARRVTFFAGVPDSTFGNAYNLALSDPEIRYVPAIREDAALGVASAAYMTGGLGGVLMQNSGLGNVVNALTSFNLVYKIPALLVIGWRGHGGPQSDAPEHWIMGPKTRELLQLLGIPTEVLEEQDWESAVDRLLLDIKKLSVPGAILVPPGVLV